jgi:peptidoglycan/xylan/chitin deacetylase (PgdA/CDA1 family)
MSLRRNSPAIGRAGVGSANGGYVRRSSRARGAAARDDAVAVQAWRGAGQPLGNHTWAHLDLNKESPEEFGAEVLRNEPLLENLMEKADWHWLRYPYLHEGDTVEKRRALRGEPR